MISKTIRNFCKDFTKIENYANAIIDGAQVWDCHHRLEELFSKKELIDKGLYYDRPPEELIFLTKADHRRLHANWKKNPFFVEKGKKRSEEHKRNLSESHKGKHWKLIDGKRVYY